MRLTLIEWSNRENRFKVTTVNVSREQLRMTGKPRTYRDPSKIGDGETSKRRRSRGSRLWRMDKHRFYVDGVNGKSLRLRWWTYRAITALFSHGHDVACLKHALRCTVLRHADGSYAGPMESRGVIQTPAGYVVIGRPSWVDAMAEGWTDRPDGGTHPIPSTMDAVRKAGSRHMRFADVDVYARNDGSVSRFTVTVNGVTVLRDATQDATRRWAVENDRLYDSSCDWWSRVEAEDAARQFASSTNG